MREFFVRIGEKPFRAEQIIKWIYQAGVINLHAMTNLSKALRTRLHDIAMIKVPKIVRECVSPDGTRKWLIKLDDGNCIETVFIPEADRGTLCVSSQVGCTLNCTFCATAHGGYNRNLGVAEIIAQVWLAYHVLGGYANGERIITNVVMMGMGEPLLNLDNVIKAIKLLLDDTAYGLSRRRVTLSTAGVVPAMDRLRETCPVSLAVSLHAPNNAVRDKLVPLNKKYPIEELLAACKRYVNNVPRHKVTFEYVMLAGVNDTPADARDLARILRGVPAKVNLIPFNPFSNALYRRSTPAAIDRFREILLQSGFIAMVRKIRGDNIDAACGQLVGRVHDRTRRSHSMRQIAAVGH